MGAVPSSRRGDLPVVSVQRVVELSSNELQCVVLCCFCKHVHVHGVVEADLWRAQAGPRKARCGLGFYNLSMCEWMGSGSLVVR
jgi:hypothetical protein